MSELATKKFKIVKRNEGPVEIKARDFRGFLGKAGDTSRTKTLRALREGRSFFLEPENGLDYHKKSDNFGRINVAIETLRNMKESDGQDSCYLHVLDRVGAQLSYDVFPEGEERRKLAHMLNRCISEYGATILISGNKAHADSSKIKKE